MSECVFDEDGKVTELKELQEWKLHTQALYNFSIWHKICFNMSI